MTREYLSRAAQIADRLEQLERELDLACTWLAVEARLCDEQGEHDKAKPYRGQIKAWRKLLEADA